MDRRKFIRDRSLLTLGFDAGSRIFSRQSGERLLAATPKTAVENTNWASIDQKAVAKASSHIIDPPWGYQPENLWGHRIRSLLLGNYHDEVNRLAMVEC